MGFLSRIFGKKKAASTSTSKVIKKYIRADDIENSVRKIFQTNTFNNLHKLNADSDYWVAVIKAVCYAESSFDTLSRYVETGLGKDVVTKKQNTSEGLMQLSYQDAKYHGCPFNWDEDKNKSDYDETKTIFDISNNIYCGLLILDKLVGKKGHYIFNDGNYWAVLKPNNKRHKVFLEKFREFYKG